MRETPRSKHLLRVATVALVAAAVSPATASIAHAQPNEPFGPRSIELSGPARPADAVPLRKAKPATCPPACIKARNVSPTALPSLTPQPSTPSHEEATPAITPVSATADTARRSTVPDTGTEWLGTAGVGLMLLGVGILLARSAQRQLR